MTRTLLSCRHCRAPLAYVKAGGTLHRLPGVRKTWERPGVWWFTCAACGHERRVTVGEEREAA